ncbi:bifunctional folylpolyglutamate synthase/dihydrofolate synthase [Acidiphilium sp. PA]|uniref:bifunctional folylpolyglutamate synthase/dihydrofolate synthase n=1 Tax=Acidiphilium sp. PA TaxID=2871705 RepID=UPI0022440C45|nr:folylpolyglutamate synthase/dihydrofolate synthase family protein [Acidiphilium sp. PA]MCW8308460.1 bifunctional folylpolyglutamate synthase/dihydrofolate synthase [Acidiphilium sp. PA]
MSAIASRIDQRLERLHTLYPKLIDLRLERLERLLAALGHPERRLPPTIHVAGTNGKGSTCAFIRAIAEAAGLRTHVYISPHLVRFNERIRLAGTLVSDDALDAALAEVERVNAAAPITVFEAITAAAFVLFAATPADLAVIEVGLGGKFDATNVIPPPRAAAITAISLDHREFLGDTDTIIAHEKSGIIKPGTHAITGRQRPDVFAVIQATAQSLGVPLAASGRDWTIEPAQAGLRYTDRHGRLTLPEPALHGAHQRDNAGIAIAALRHSGIAIPDAAYAEGMRSVEWPARMQRLGAPLLDALPPGSTLWLDGAHNPGGAEAIAEALADFPDPTHLIIGMKQAKDCAEFLRIVAPHAASIQAIAEPGQHLALPVEQIIAASGGIATAGPTLDAALRQLAADTVPKRVLICGSLYLAGVILARQALVAG